MEKPTTTLCTPKCQSMEPLLNRLQGGVRDLKIKVGRKHSFSSYSIEQCAQCLFYIPQPESITFSSTLSSSASGRLQKKSIPVFTSNSLTGIT